MSKRILRKFRIFFKFFPNFLTFLSLFGHPRPPLAYRNAQKVIKTAYSIVQNSKNYRKSRLLAVCAGIRGRKKYSKEVSNIF